MNREEQVSFVNAIQEKQFTKLVEQIKEIRAIIDRNKANIFENEEVFDNEIRTLNEVEEAETEFFEKIWLDRHFSLKYRVEELGKKIDSEIWKSAQEFEQKLVAKYGEENIGPYSDFEWGMLNGKLSALRWVLGFEWDMLDT